MWWGKWEEQWRKERERVNKKSNGRGVKLALKGMGEKKDRIKREKKERGNRKSKDRKLVAGNENEKRDERKNERQTEKERESKGMK